MTLDQGLHLNGLTTLREGGTEGGPVDLRVGPGELLFLGGASGVGKSLLLRAIADLDPHKGEIYLNGVEHQSVSGPAWRRQVGMLAADSPWWLERVADHFPKDSEPLPMLTGLGLPEEAMTWPITRLSSGERQRLALIRLLLHQPAALLLDEPTANLDQAATGWVEAMVLDYMTNSRDRQGVPVIWVSHQPEQIRRLGGRRYHMESDGRVSEVAP